MVEVSVIVLTKNEERNLGSCLEGVFRQRTRRTFEVLVIDSGSEDATLTIAKRFPVRIEQIPPESFHHARTRNLGARWAKGEFLIYLAADACPASEDWVEALLVHFADPQVAAVYGKQIAKQADNLERMATFRYVCPDRRLVKEASKKKELGYLYYYFTTVNAAIRKAVWRSFPFPEERKVFEDVGFAKAVLESGWKIVYEPRAAVYHSHVHSLSGLFKRYFDLGVTWQMLGIWNRDLCTSLLRDGLRMIQGRGDGVPGSGARALPASTMVKGLGLACGLSHRYLPKMFKRRMSAFGLFEEA